MFNNWRVRNKSLLLLWLIFFMAYMDRVNFAVAVPIITQELSLSTTQIGAIMSALFIGYGSFQIVGGILADKFGARRMITFALIWWPIFTFLTGLAQGFIYLFIVRAMFGAGEAMHPPASWKFISTWFPSKERVQANSLNMCSIALGPAFAPMIVVTIMQYFDWRTVFYIFPIPSFILAYFVWKYLRDTPQQHPDITSTELQEINTGTPLQNTTTEKMSLSKALRDKNLLLLALIYLCLCIPFWGFVSWLPSYLVNVRQFTMVKMGATAGIPFLVAFIGMLLSNYICTNVFAGSKQKFICAAALLAAISMYLAFGATDIFWCMFYLCLTALGIFICFGPFWALPMESLSSDAMGLASGFINTGGQIGGFIAPLLMGYLIQLSGGSYQMPFAVMIGMLILTAILALFVQSERN